MCNTCIIVTLLSVHLTAIYFCSGQSTDIVLFKNNEYYSEMYCIGSNTNNESALVWITTSGESLKQKAYASNYVCQITKSTWCIRNNFIPNGIYKNSLEQFAGVVLDRRWEGFKEITTKGEKIVKLAEISQYNFVFAFSLRIEENGYLYLCDYSYPWRAENCYFIVMGGWKNKKVALRRCFKNQHFQSFEKYPVEPCRSLVSEFNDTVVVTNLKWNHFVINKTNDKISLYHYGHEDPILTFLDDKPFKPTYAMIRSTVEGYWKLHDYNFLAITAKHSESAYFTLSSNHVCITVYVKPCRDCNINIILQTQWDKQTVASLTATKKSEWQSVTLRSKQNVRGVQLNIIITVEGVTTEPYLIGDIVDCSGKEVQKIYTYFDKNVCCHSIKHDIELCGSILTSKATINPNTDDRCPADTFGESCISCNIFDNCKGNNKYCEVSSEYRVQSCSCHRGYKEPDCWEPCAKGYYGKSCKYQCSIGCDECNNISGKCSKCKKNLFSPDNNCTTFYYPILTNKPEIISVGHTDARIKIDFNSYKGEVEPIAYEIQLYNGNNWHTRGPYTFRDSTIKIVDSLLPSTRYRLKIVLLDASGGKEDRSEFLPIQEFNTTCEDIAKDDIILLSYGSSVNVYISNNPKSCPLSQYKFFNGMYNTVLTNNTYPLRKCTNYNFNILKEDVKLYDYNLRTGEDGVSIQCVEFNNTDTTSIITWNKYQNDARYNVSYEYLGSSYEDCPVISQKRIIEVEEPKVELNNLIPYSKYQVSIENEARHISRQIRINTKSGENINMNELENLSYTQKDNYLYIALSVNCEKVKGPMNVSVHIQCVSSFCVNTEIETTSSFFSKKISEPPLKFSVEGLSEYKIEIHANRNGMTDVKFDSKITNATASGPVTDLTIYSKTKQSLSIRWKPAHPPMGHLSYYSFKYEYKTRWNTYDNSLIKNVSSCELWEDYHCAYISNLYENTHYKIEVQPVNDPDLYGKVSSVYGITVEESVFDLNKTPSVKFYKILILEPNPPTFLELIWTENYEMLQVTFPHPDVTNGPLTQFEVYQNFLSPAVVKIQKENATYSHFITNFPPSSEVSIVVRVKNSAGASDPIRNTTHTPPPIPELKTSNIHINANITNITLELPEIAVFQGNVMCLIAIIVTDISSPSQLNLDTFAGEDRIIIEKSKVPYNYISWVAWKKSITKNERNTLLYIGDDKSSTNKILRPDNEYKLTVFIENNYRNKSKSIVWTSVTRTLIDEATDSNLLLLLILLIIPIICIGILFLRYKGIKITMSKIYHNRTREASNEDTVVLQPVKPVRLKPKPMIYQNIEEARKDAEFSRPISIAELENYIKESLASDEFERQHELKVLICFFGFFEGHCLVVMLAPDVDVGLQRTRKNRLFPRGQTKPWTIGTKPENKSKNRYVNLAAYDHSRVKLDIINKDANSDYINANYIDGYNIHKAFIATQGPKVNTLNDFWRMIWQENVEYIVMIANLEEGGKKKVAKYWPDINETLTFGEVSVKYMSVTVFANYEERIFTASSQGVNRMVKQLHFTSWPDHGVPMYAQSLAPFLKKILTLPQDTAPIVVHCSAGVGRTGTLILADICLRMAAKEGYVDVLYHQYKIREQRPNMVDNVEQYKLVHLLLLHCLIAPETSIICTENMTIIIEELLASKEVINQMKYLEEITWQDEAMHTTATKVTLPIIYEKNRFRNIIPDEYSRIILPPYPPTDETSMYINAIKVDGFQAPGKFIVTQYPLRNTVGDFWRLIMEREITIAVCLNDLCLDDDISGTFFPSTPNTTLTPIPYLNITLFSMEEDAIFNTYTLHVANLKKKGEVIKFTLIHLKNWTYNQVCPKNPMFLLTLFEEMNRIGKQAEHILISCYDGVRASGLFTALCFLIEKIKLEQVCDVCLAVRTVRHSRKEFVREVEQFRFLYMSALEYVEMFKMYSNFRL